MNKIIDLRSDTVTQPDAGMRAVIANAPVGDDVYREDPSVNELEALAAKLLKKEAALFVSSGTQSNLLALLCHCQRGDEYIAGQLSHIYCEEGGGGAVFGSIQPQPVENLDDGSLDLDIVASKIKDHSDVHFAKTRLLCLENTMYGRVLSLDYMARAQQLAKANQLSIHLDGARLFNASTALHVPAHAVCQYFDSISFCLSKGLGAPVGSLLVGSQELIERARHWRKALGGGMRQAGLLASAGMYALTRNVERLQTDHEHARLLAEGLAEIDEIDVKLDWCQSNMVFFDIKNQNKQQFLKALADKGVLALDEGLIRMVVHLDITDMDIDQSIFSIKECVRHEIA